MPFSHLPISASPRPRVSRFLLPLLLLALCAPLLRAEKAWRLTAPNDMIGVGSRLDPGDVCLLPDATWTDQKLVLKANGTREKPVLIKPFTPGKFILTGKSSLTIEGDWLILDGLVFKDLGLEDGDGVVLKGNNNRITNCVFDGGTPKFLLRVFGMHHRIDHCYFANKTSGEPTLQIEVDEKTPNYHRIDRNHFGYRAPLGRNGGETIRVGYSGQSLWNSRTTVEQNLFERCDGEIEIISSKSCENIYRANTFRDCDGMLTLRHGNRCLVDGNFFFGGGKRGSGGIRVIGEDHVITNNYIENVKQGGIWLTTGVPDGKLNQYYQADRALVAFNTIVDSAGPYLDLSAGLGGAGRTIKPKDVVIANNLFVLGEGAQLLKGEAGANWKWQSNLASSPRALQLDHAGIRTADAHLERGAGGLLRPAAQSPARGAATGNFPAIKTDIDGHPRSAPLDIGCDQHSAAPAPARPLTPADVGPTWRK